MTSFEWDLGNGTTWVIHPETNVLKKRIFKIKHIVLTEAEEARELMYKYYEETLKQPVPPEEEAFALAMIEAEKNPPPPTVIEEPVVHDENYIPPMPDYGTKEFFVWCSKTKKAREALKKKKEDAKAAVLAEKTQEKNKILAEKAAKLAAKEAARLEKESIKLEKEARKAAKAASKVVKNG